MSFVDFVEEETVNRYAFPLYRCDCPAIPVVYNAMAFLLAAATKDESARMDCPKVYPPYKRRSKAGMHLICSGF